MYNIEIHETINRIVKIFRKFRLWRNNEKSSDLSQMGRKLIYLLVKVCFALSIISGGILSDDKNESVYLIVVGIAILVLAVKLAFILQREEKISAFILEVGAHSVENHEEFVKVNNKVNRLMKFSFCFILMVFVASVIVLSLPVFSTEKRLPVNIWFPLNWKNDTFSYWIAFVFISIGVIIGFISILLTVIVWYLMMSCAIKYQIIGNQFRYMAAPTKGSVKKEKMSEAEKEKLFVLELIGLIKTHQNIQKYLTCISQELKINFILLTRAIDRFKCCFANLFFTQITTSGICICGSVYVLVFGHENLLDTMINFAVIIYNIFDIFMVMYFGNEIQLSSDRLSYCLFESNWIERSQSYKKYIIILTEVLKQPHELVIGKLYPLNLETFTSIVNGAYSMFNILQNFN